MPIIERYEIRIEAVLDGSPTANANEVRNFQQELYTNPPRVGKGGLGSPSPWPDGFVLAPSDPTDPYSYTYTPAIWKAEAYDYPGGKTRLYFHAEVSGFDTRELTDPGLQSDVGDNFKWFITNDAQKWCIDLQGRLGGLNNTFGNKVIEPLRIRRLHYYLGDGGGG